MVEIHNFFNKLLLHFCTNHEQTFRDYIPNANESNKVFYDLPAKPFHSKLIKFKNTLRVSLGLYGKQNSCYTCCLYVYAVESFYGSLCGKWQYKLKVSDIYQYTNCNKLIFMW